MNRSSLQFIKNSRTENFGHSFKRGFFTASQRPPELVPKNKLKKQQKNNIEITKIINVSKS